MGRVVLIASLVSAAAHLAAGADREPSKAVALSLTTVKDRIGAGEPLELRLEIVNRGAEPVSMTIHYPRFEFDDCQGLALDLNNTGLTARPLSKAQEYARDFGGLHAGAKIPAGGTWAVRVPLQSYVLPPKPGKYKVDYVLELRLRPVGLVRTSGTLAFEVGPEPAAADLKAIYDKLAERTESKDWWEQRSAMEAIGKVGTKAAVPYLIEMHAWHAFEAWEGLAASPVTDDGVQLATAALDSPDPVEVSRALNALTAWKTRPPARVADLARSDDAGVREDARRYLEAVGQPHKP